MKKSSLENANTNQRRRGRFAIRVAALGLLTVFSSRLWAQNSQGETSTAQREWTRLERELTISRVASPLKLEDYPGLSLDSIVEVEPRYRAVLPLAVELTHPEILPHIWGAQRGAGSPSSCFCLSDDDLLATGDAAWRNGDVDAAANCWNALWQRLSYGTVNLGSPLVRSEVAARLATWDANAGRPGSARNWLSSLNDEERAGIARFAGRSGAWGELMESVIESEAPTAERTGFAMTRQLRVPIEHAAK
ncbi:MAG: hypothetical protein KDA66_15395, partial [Planctomycetaceae bacterium]|nr:hypothetical protein [Planctomycetaceae bacterium]